MLVKLTLTIIACLSLSLISESQTASRWYINTSNGEKGFIDSTGTVIFAREFDWLFDTYDDGLVHYKKGTDVGFLDVNGNVAFNLQPSQTWVYGFFSEGLCCVNDPNHFYYINPKGEIALDLKELELPLGKELSWCQNFHNGLALVRLQNVRNKAYDPGPIDVITHRNLYPGEWFYGFINKSGKWIIEPKFDEAFYFNDGITTVEQNGRLYLLDTVGNIVAAFDSTNINVFWKGFAIVNFDSISYFIDKQGKRISQVNFSNLQPFADGMAAVEIVDKWGFINTKGEIVIEPKYDDVEAFSEGVASVTMRVHEKGISHDNYYILTGFIDKKGKTVIPFEKNVRYDYRGFRRGLVQGKRSIYDESNRFSGYYELFYIDKKGVKIWSDLLKQ